MNLPLVSIVTPSYNQGAFIEKAILSVLSQDYPNLEYIVIDGNSTDDSYDIIRKYEDRINLCVREDDTGQSNAINKGFSKARGDIFAWLNSDDMFLPSTIKTAVFFLLKQQAGLVYGDRVHIDNKDNVRSIRQCPSHDPKMFKKNFTLPQETAFFRREVYEAAGGLDEDLHFAMDFDLWCKMAKVTAMYHIPVFLGYFREHSAAKSVQFHSKVGDIGSSYLKEHQEVYKKHFMKSLPSALEMKWNRIGRAILLNIEQRSNRYQTFKKLIRKVTEFDIKPDTTADVFLSLGDSIEG